MLRPRVIARVHADRDRLAARRSRAPRSGRPAACRRRASWPRAAPSIMKSPRRRRGSAPTGPPSPLHSANQSEVDVPADLGDRHVEIRAGVEQARAVEVNRQSRAPARHRGIAAMFVQRHDGAAGGVVRVLEANQPGRRERRVAGPADRALHVVRVDRAVTTLDRPRRRRRRRSRGRRPRSCRCGRSLRR